MVFYQTWLSDGDYRYQVQNSVFTGMDALFRKAARA